MGQIGSRRGVGHRLAIAALALGLGTGAAACSSGTTASPIAFKAPIKSTAASGSNTSGSPTSTAVAAGSASTAGGASSTTASTAGTTTTKTSDTTTPITAVAPASVSKQTTTTKVTTPVSTGPAPTAPGSYQYTGGGSTTITTSSGSVPSAAPTTATLDVTGGTTEQWQWVDSGATTNLSFTSAGVYLTSEAVSFEGFSATCSFPSVASPPWPLATGKHAQGTASCGTAGSGTLTVVVGAAGSVRVNGAAVKTFQVTTTLTLGPVSLKEIDSYAPSLRLPVTTTIVDTGSYGTYSFLTKASYAL